MSRGSVAAARAAADAATLEEDAFLGEVFTRLHEVIGEVGEARWPARGPRVVAAAVRVLAREQARLDAAYLRLLPRSRAGRTWCPGSAADPAGRPRSPAPPSAWTRAGPVGTPTPPASPPAATPAPARDLDDGVDSARVGAAYAAGEITRAHVDVAVGVHRRLRAQCP